MAFSKAFPKTIEGLSYPKWIEVYLSEEEEADIEQGTRVKNKRMLAECIKDAQQIVQKLGLNTYQSDVVSMAVAMFEKRAPHTVHEKERRCKDKFDAENAHETQ
ncbi:MAG: hypothetical protein ACOC32_01995 [Nanoarchaeota archaeon]